MKTFFIIIITIFALVLGFRLILDNLIKQKINKTLTNTAGYEGRVDDVSLNFIDGNYTVKKLHLKQLANDTLLPFINVDSVLVSVQWNALMEGKLEGSIDIYQPKLNVLMTKDSTKSSRDAYWGKKLSNTVPFRINEIRVRNGKISYTNYTVKPTVDAYLSNMNATVKNLTNMEDSTTKLPASLTASANAEGEGQLKVDMEMNMINRIPVMYTDLQLTSVDLTQLNDFIKAYGNFDVQQGTMSLYAQIEVRDESVDGYLKPVFYNLEIFSLKQTDDQSLGKTGLEALLGLGSNLLENNPKERLSAKIPIHGEVNSIETDISEALETAMNN